MTPSSLGDTASTAPVAAAASRTRRAASGEANSPSASATHATRRIPRRRKSSAQARMTPTNSARFLSLCQSNLRRWFSCLCCRHLRRIAKSAPAGAKSLQWLAGSFIIGRGAGECAPSVSSWPCCSSITRRATSSRSMGGASGNAEHRRSVIPSSLRRYSSLCFRAEGKGGTREVAHEGRGRLGLVFARNETRARRAPRDREIRGRAGKPRGFRGAHLEVLRAELDLPLHRCRRHLGAVGREGDPPETLGAVPTAMLKSLSELRRSSPGAPRTRRESARV